MKIFLNTSNINKPTIEITDNQMEKITQQRFEERQADRFTHKDITRLRKECGNVKSNPYGLFDCVNRNVHALLDCWHCAVARPTTMEINGRVSEIVFELHDRFSDYTNAKYFTRNGERNSIEWTDRDKRIETQLNKMHNTMFTTCEKEERDNAWFYLNSKK